jgi:alcohol dehydrogenase class IV
VSAGRLAELSFALGAGSTAAAAEENAAAAVNAVVELYRSVGMNHRLSDYNIHSAAFPQIAEDALDDEVLANAPLKPTANDVERMLAAAS